MDEIKDIPFMGWVFIIAVMVCLILSRGNDEKRLYFYNTFVAFN